MAGQFRTRYGLAVGRENNFYTGIAGQKGYLAGTDGLLAQGNSTPDVTNGYLFYTNNTGNTTIRDFILSHPAQANGNIAGLFEGKKIFVWFLDGSTRLAYSTSGPIIGVGTDGLQGANSVAEFIYHTSSWYMIDYNRISNNFATYGSGNVNYSANSSLNVRGLTTVALNNTGGSQLTFVTLTGGEQNQTVLLYASNSAVQFTVNTGGLANSIITTTGGTVYNLNSNATLSVTFISPYWIASK